MGQASDIALKEALPGTDCEVILDNPHASGHVPGTTDSDARIRCKTPKKYLGVNSQLFRFTSDGIAEAVGVPGENKDTSGAGRFISAPATWDQCQNGLSMGAHADYLVVDQNDGRFETFLDRSGNIANCP
ncbi:hypothetical protein E1181_16070 [Saccharopolyspora terrae]|uniref:Uncharacterized protein n=1 Tax=Saccharopolyspora terrae TaxID=2530384 RepID=A0A4R4VM34_9PSEU|nr:hypothetical protein [Saccharopolyspora terrae]TDD05007.1 hypothetical protein E1181_16070 [Saccharopolyspora terrae]